jgi:hypothetical protein
MLQRQRGRASFQNLVKRLWHFVLPFWTAERGEWRCGEIPKVDIGA